MVGYLAQSPGVTRRQAAACVLTNKVTCDKHLRKLSFNGSSNTTAKSMTSSCQKFTTVDSRTPYIVYLWNHKPQSSCKSNTDANGRPSLLFKITCVNKQMSIDIAYFFVAIPCSACILFSSNAYVYGHRQG